MTQTFGLKLDNDLKMDKFLQLTVATTRKILKCERVIIYSAKELSKGLVLAESFSSKQVSIIGKRIKDPFLTGKYFEMYSYGMPVAIDDIYLTDQNTNDLKDLIKLGVKSLMLAPIAQDNQLVALLAAYKCSQIQLWHHETVIFLTEKANEVSSTLAEISQASNSQDYDLVEKLAKNLNYLTIQPKEVSKENNYRKQQEPKMLTPAAQSPPVSDSKILDKLEQENILNLKVEEVRRILNCDRVLIHTVNQDNSATLLAESVAVGCSKVQDQVIERLYFESKYKKLYRQGKSQAISNIYESKLSQDYLQQLQQLEVKAILVTPILNKGKLFGLLVAHQCSDIRQWGQTENFWLSQIASQISLAIENAQLFLDAQKLRQQLQEENKWTEYFTNTIQKIRQSLKTKDILQTSVEEVKRILNCDRVVVYALNQDNYGIIINESVGNGWVQSQSKQIKDLCCESKYLEEYHNGKVRAIDNIYNSGLTQSYIGQLEKLEVKANLVTPIINEGKLFGLLVAHQCSAPRQWQQVEIRWIAQIATQISFALDNAQLSEQLNQSTQMSQQVFRQKYGQIESLKHQIVEILTDKGYAYQNLSQETMGQYETTMNALYQIQKSADSFSAIPLNLQQVTFQGQQNDLVLQNTQENLQGLVNNISQAQNTFETVAEELENCGSSSFQQIFDRVNTFKVLGNQIVQQSMSILKFVNRNQIENNEQNSLVDLSDTMLSLLQQLFEVTAQIDPLFTNIKTDFENKTSLLKSGTQQLIKGIGEFKTVNEGLDQVITLNQQMSTIMGKITKSIENHQESSTFTYDSVKNLAGIAERISEQSIIINQSFQKLVALVQQL